MIIENTNTYYIEYIIDDTLDKIFVRYFGIKEEYQGQGLSRKIFNDLKEKYKKDIYLDCDLSLIPFYLKIGFEDNGQKFNQEYHEMILKYDNT